MRTWADDVEDQRRDRDREQRRLIECQHGALRRQCEICKRDARIAELEAALQLIRTICAIKVAAHHNVAAIDHHAAVALGEDK